MKRNRFAKIIASLGPSANDEAAVSALFDAGADVFRINMGYGTRKDHLTQIKAIRAVEAKKGCPIAIIADLAGPKMRIGDFADGPITLKVGQHFDLDQDETPGDSRRVCFPHPWAYAHLGTNDRLELDDGRVVLQVLEANLFRIRTTVIAGETLLGRKAIKVPKQPKSEVALSDKDSADLDFALYEKVDWVAVSLGNNPDNIRQVRELLGTGAHSKAGLLVKIDNNHAIEAFDDLVQWSDGIMLARADIGSAIPVEDIPSMQKTLVSKARQWARPVVVAGQMLESMVQAPAPTRAEASDVATAVFDGADAVTLSAETAIGDYPVDAVEMMDRVLETAEADESFAKGFIEVKSSSRSASIGAAIARAASETAQDLGCAAIVCHTSSGATARRVARTRPSCQILCLSEVVATTRRMALVWGTRGVLSGELKGWQDIVANAKNKSLELGAVKSGDTIAITAGMPLNQSGTTNILRVAEID